MMNIRPPRCLCFGITLDMEVLTFGDARTDSRTGHDHGYPGKERRRDGIAHIEGLGAIRHADDNENPYDCKGCKTCKADPASESAALKHLECDPGECCRQSGKADGNAQRVEHGEKIHGNRACLADHRGLVYNPRQEHEDDQGKSDDAPDTLHRAELLQYAAAGDRLRG